MKLQHLAIIFIVIILPISMVITTYIQTQIDTIKLQSLYSTKLSTATYDAIKAFQLNTLNNKYSSLSDSKIRDIEASISTFYNSLGSELGASGYNKESLQQFIPAIVYTMYDGYYIYGKYYNYEANQYQFGLKPYIYYSCRYKNNLDDFVVNYTLDNNITIYGKVNGEYVTKTGALINPDLVQIGTGTVIYDGVQIEPEVLEEQIVVLKNVGYVTEYYEYITYNNQKVYYDKNNSNMDQQYFWYNNNEKQYITDEDTLAFARNSTYNGHLYSNSGMQYYIKAFEFSNWVKQNIGNITQRHAVDSEGNQITDFAVDTQNERIFNFSASNNPLLDESTFNQNRISVIRKTIQTTLNTAISNYSSSAEYEFSMPIFTEEDWDKLSNDISVAVFMQGIPIGSKYYNNYCIITNNKNKEFVSKESFYIVTNDNTENTENYSKNNNEIHRVSSRDVIDNSKEVIAAYRNIDFERQTIETTQGDAKHYYPHANKKCYECMVNIAETYNIDDIIAGAIKVYDKNTDTFVVDTGKNISKLRKVFLTAFAREKYDLYRTNNYFSY